MKLFVDDERNAPKGYTVVRTNLSAIRALRQFDFDEISLDHDDGGEGFIITAYFIVEKYKEKKPVIILHTANPIAREEMFRLFAENGFQVWLKV